MFMDYLYDSSIIQCYGKFSRDFFEKRNSAKIFSIAVR
jgi:hypothetical protein